MIGGAPQEARIIRLALKLDAARRDVAVHIITPVQENDPVARRIRLILFQLVFWNDNPGSDVDMFSAQRFIGSGVGNDGDVSVAVDFKRIRPISVSFTAA